MLMRSIRTAAALVLTLYAVGVLAELTPEQLLGQMLYMDTDLSLHRNQSCNSCHDIQPVTPRGQSEALPSAGFIDPDNVREGTAVSKGSIEGATGALNTPSVGYARFSPHFHWDGEEGLYIGGQFWNGRAATLAEQAMGPPLNPLEMAMPSQWAVVSRLKESPVYVRQFRELYGIDLGAIPSNDSATADLIPAPGVQEAYERMARAIAEFEKSRVFNRFTSKYDYVMVGMTEFTELERTGLELFNNDKSQCSACHTSEPVKAPAAVFCHRCSPTSATTTWACHATSISRATPSRTPDWVDAVTSQRLIRRGRKWANTRSWGCAISPSPRPICTTAHWPPSRKWCTFTIRATASRGAAAISTTRVSGMNAGRNPKSPAT